MGEAQTRYHISLDVADRPGVLAAGGVGLRRPRACRSRRCASRSSRPPTRTGPSGRANLVIVTHTAPDAALSATVEALAAMPTSSAPSTRSCAWRVPDVAHQWRGVIREYADRLPVAGRDARW